MIWSELDTVNKRHKAKVRGLLEWLVRRESIYEQLEGLVIPEIDEAVQTSSLLSKESISEITITLLQAYTFCAYLYMFILVISLIPTLALATLSIPPSHTFVRS